MKRSLTASPSLLTAQPLFSGALALFGAACLGLTSASAALINVNISATPTGNSAIDGAETFGLAAEGTVSGNWSNIASFANAIDLVRGDGTISGVEAITRNGGGQQFWGPAYINTPWNYGVASFSGTGGAVTMQLNNLNAEFPSGFYAIVYVNGAPANTGAGISDGTTTYFFQTANPRDLTPVQITDTVDDGVYLVGNYAVFGSSEAPLTADSVTFSIPTGSVLDTNAGIGGVQLVAIPEPSAGALMVGGAVLALLLVRRRRSTQSHV